MSARKCASILKEVMLVLTEWGPTLTEVPERFTLSLVLTTTSSFSHPSTKTSGGFSLDPVRHASLLGRVLAKTFRRSGSSLLASTHFYSIAILRLATGRSLIHLLQEWSRLRAIRD